MTDRHKTKAQLAEELKQTRQRVAKLEENLAQCQQVRADLEQTAAIEKEKRIFAETLQQAAAILGNTLNYESVLDYILEQAAQIVPHDAACLMLVEEETARVFRWHGYARGEFDPFFAAPAFNLADIPVLQTIQETGQPLVIPVVRAEDPPIYGFETPLFDSHLAVPIRTGDELIGFLHLDRMNSASFNQVEAERLQIFANQAAAALKNSQLYHQARQEILERVKALKKERNFISAVLDTAGALVMVLNPRGRILRFNRACEQITGYSIEEVRGKPFWDLFLVPAELETVKSIFNSLRAGQLTNEYECYWLTRDGQRRLIVWSNSVLLDHSNSVEYIVSSGIDITERRQLEDRLLAIHRLGQTLNLLRDEVDILEMAQETAASLLQFDSVGYGLLDETDGNLIYGYRPDYRQPSPIELHLPLDTDERLDALQTYREEAGVDKAVDTRVEPVSTEHSDSFWLTAPIKIGDYIIGVLDVERYEANDFSTKDQQLLQTLADQTAVALENARLHEEARQRVAELATMNVIGQAITSTLNLEETLKVVTDHAIRLLGAAAASVVLHDEARDNLWFNTASGGEPDFVRGKRLEVGQGIVGWVIQHGTPAMVPDVSKDSRFFSEFDQKTGFTTRSVLCVPLQTKNRTVGAIEVMNKKNGLFTPEDMRLLGWLASPATIAIENARLFEAERTARQQAEILQEASFTLTSILNPDEVLNSILVYLEEVIPYDRACVLLQSGDWLTVVAERGSPHPQEQLADRQYPVDNGVYRNIQNTGTPVILEDVQADPSLEIWERTDKVRGWMGVPLVFQNQVSGCLTLNNKQAAAYGQVEANLAHAFANQAAIAIQNARLFEQLRISRKQQQSLSRRLVEIQEAERRHIARELHDEAGQALTLLMFGLGALAKEADNPSAVAGRAAKLKNITNEISKNLHRLAVDLRPASLDHLGLVAALRQYVEKFSHQHDLTVQLETIGLDDRRLPLAVETNLYRIVQEALTNIAKHAQASRVDLLLERRGDWIFAIIEDNGMGFDPEVAKQNNRLGLLGMRERTEMMEGSLVVESIVGTGTTIYVEVPYVDSHFNR